MGRRWTDGRVTDRRTINKSERRGDRWEEGDGFMGGDDRRMRDKSKVTSREEGHGWEGDGPKDGR